MFIVYPYLSCGKHQIYRSKIQFRQQEEKMSTTFRPYISSSRHYYTHCISKYYEKHLEYKKNYKGNQGERDQFWAAGINRDVGLEFSQNREERAAQSSSTMHRKTEPQATRHAPLALEPVVAENRKKAGYMTHSNVFKLLFNFRKACWQAWHSLGSYSIYLMSCQPPE